ncbi:MAG TPA: chemotaxis protein CheD [Bacillota bacterium]|nr:chemotaxis protein CheD [Bacillota bacterium]
MSTTVRVGMSEIRTASSPDLLVTLGLGSCVGICLYDPVIQLGGMAHVMLPDSSLAREVTSPGKFADTAVPILLKEMDRRGALRKRLIVKIVGGAQMFSMGGQDDQMSIGLRNVTAVENALKKEGLVILARSVGGNLGKTVTLETETGRVKLRTINAPETLL